MFAWHIGKPGDIKVCLSGFTFFRQKYFFENARRKGLGKEWGGKGEREQVRRKEAFAKESCWFCPGSIPLAQRPATQPRPSKTSPFCQLKPHEETQMVICRKVSYHLGSSLHCAWASLLVADFWNFLCVQTMVICQQSDFWRRNTCSSFI